MRKDEPKPSGKSCRIAAANLAELYREAARQYGPLPAFAARLSSLKWEPVSFSELYERGLDLATGLIELGAVAREHIGLFGDNCFEWILADYGVQLCGAADVPRGNDVTDAELSYIINHADVRIAFVETETLMRRILDLRSELPGLSEIILLAPGGRLPPGIRSIREVSGIGSRLRSRGDRRAEERAAKIRPDDLFTLIYTSGTTGQPKGVMLTHANMASQIKTIPTSHCCTDRMLSILPIWHIFERVFEMVSISCGACTYYSSVRTFAEDIQNVEPTFIGSAPRLWENLHGRILKSVRESHPVRRALFSIAYFLARNYRESGYFIKGKTLRLRPQPVWERMLLLPFHAARWAVLLPWYGFFNAVVLERVRVGSVGSLKATVSGGGALPIEIDRFFNYIGIPVLEGFGMTETAPVIAARTPDALVIGTVGPPIPGTEIRITDIETGAVLFPGETLPHGGRGRKGEIWVRGPQVMKGYYRQPELTGEIIRDGWLRTGDLGMITHNGCLKMLGRCKSTIVLSSGENVEPEPIEMRLCQSPYIDYCMAVGQDQKFIGALVVPVLEEFRKKGIKAGCLGELASDSCAQRTIREEIRKSISVCSGFKSYEQIRDFRILTAGFQRGDELTSLFKLKRHIIEAKYMETIRGIYAPESGGVN